MDFWYEFDDYFLFHRPSDIDDATNKLDPYGNLRNRFYYYQENAFELFAQGLLFDNGLDNTGLPRRPAGDKIHMMDSSVEGYVVWHAFVRAVVILDATSDKDRWLEIDRYIALAAAILSALITSGKEPIQSDDPTRNRRINTTLLEELRAHWLNLSFKDIDDKIVQLRQNVISRHI